MVIGSLGRGGRFEQTEFMGALNRLGMDADEPATVEAQSFAVAVAERGAPRGVVGLGEAGHQRWRDGASMAHDQGQRNALR